jgi:hypothetical protein
MKRGISFKNGSTSLRPGRTAQFADQEDAWEVGFWARICAARARGCMLRDFAGAVSCD